MRCWQANSIHYRYKNGEANTHTNVCTVCPAVCKYCICCIRAPFVCSEIPCPSVVWCDVGWEDDAQILRNISNFCPPTLQRVRCPACLPPTLPWLFHSSSRACAPWTENRPSMSDSHMWSALFCIKLKQSGRLHSLLDLSLLTFS